MKFLYLFFFISAMLLQSEWALSSNSSEVRLGLEQDILTARLEGDYVRALAQTERLKMLPDSYHLGIALDLDTRLTRLSWDSHSTGEDDYLFGLSEALIALCPKNRRQSPPETLFQCGRGHFGHSYLSALRGNLFDAGSHGSQAIKAFEAALAKNPDLTAVKLPLGMAYFYADHLPSFAKLMAPFLWFIPTGNSDKSLPYIEAVMVEGGPYADAARFIYSDLIMQKAPERMQEASRELEGLVSRYPSNPRLHLAHISSYAYQNDWRGAYSAVKKMDGSIQQASPFTAVGKIWKIYILKYLNQPLPRDLQSYILEQTTDGLPRWTEDWLMLAQGLANDFSGDRNAATALYQQVLDSGNRFGSGWLLELAAEGLDTNLYPGKD